MYLKNTSNEVKELVIKINELDRDDKLKFISYVFNLWDRDQINSLSEVNPSLLDDSIDIEIFNVCSIRFWQCPKCDSKHDRDYNAANNILDKGIELLLI